MRSTLSTLVLCGGLAAQAFYIPDNLATTGTCNVIPFGSTAATGSFSTCLTQQIYTAAELGNTPGLITGIEFAPCGNGSSRFADLQVVLDLLPANSTLSNTFATNLTPNATVVLDAPNYVWHTTANTWAEIGLQNYFVYDGVSDLVVQVRCNQSASPAGFHRSTTHRRLYATGWSGTPPATGTLSSTTAQKIGITMLMARGSTYGAGCLGSNALAPRLALSGSPQLGQLVSMDLQQGPALSLAFFVIGFTNAFPLPVDLGGLGAPGCMQYVSTDSVLAFVTDPAGGALAGLAVPNDAGFAGQHLYAQWACFDPSANPLGVTTSTYARLLLGN